jgi:thiol-disulfide isomerase/thioredoxin
MKMDRLRRVKNERELMMIGLSTISKTGLLVSTLLSLAACKPSSPIATPATPQVIQQQIKNSTAPLTLVHVWATWCDPCREEFPELIKATSEFQSLEVILISADAPDEANAVVNFLTTQKSPFNSLISTELNQDFIESLSPKWAGSLPSTFFFRAGKLVDEWEGKRTAEEYTKTIQSLLPTRKEP